MSWLPFEIDLSTVPGEDGNLLSRERHPLPYGDLGACISGRT